MSGRTNHPPLLLLLLLLLLPFPSSSRRRSLPPSPSPYSQFSDSSSDSFSPSPPWSPVAVTALLSLSPSSPPSLPASALTTSPPRTTTDAGGFFRRSRRAFSAGASRRAAELSSRAASQGDAAKVRLASLYLSLPHPSSFPFFSSSSSSPADAGYDAAALLAALDEIHSAVETNTFSNAAIWSHIHTKNGVTVHRTNTDVKGTSSGAPQETPIIRARYIISASPSDVMALYDDNERVEEYNNNCRELEDLAVLERGRGRTTTINRCATKRMGPFK